jgi:hypothetical protein
MAALAALGGLVWWRSRHQHPQAPPTDPAEELRAKLAEARAADDRDEFEAGETPVDQVDVRRQDVHERARSAIDELGAE